MTKPEGGVPFAEMGSAGPSIALAPACRATGQLEARRTGSDVDVKM